MIGVPKPIIQITVTGMAMELVTVVTPVHGNTMTSLLPRNVIHLLNCIGLILTVMDCQIHVITALIIPTLSRQLTLMVIYPVRANRALLRQQKTMTPLEYQMLTRKLLQISL